MSVTPVGPVIRVVDRDAHRPDPDQYRRQTKPPAVPREAPPPVETPGSPEMTLQNHCLVTGRGQISPEKAIAAYKAMLPKDNL